MSLDTALVAGSPEMTDRALDWISDEFGNLAIIVRWNDGIPPGLDNLNRPFNRVAQQLGDLSLVVLRNEKRAKMYESTPVASGGLHNEFDEIVSFRIEWSILAELIGQRFRGNHEDRGHRINIGAVASVAHLPFPVCENPAARRQNLRLFLSNKVWGRVLLEFGCLKSDSLEFGQRVALH